MPDELSPDFERLCDDLEVLSRQHLLYFRVQVGRVVATQLFAGDIATMRAEVTSRQGVIRSFATACADRLHDLGLNEDLLRKSLKAWAVVQLLPDEIVAQLGFTHVVALARVDDDETRALLAASVVQNGWGGRQLADAIADVEAGLWPDGDPGAPGLQPAPPPPEPAPLLAPGRVVNRFEKVVEDLDALVAPWEAADMASLPSAQRKRAKAALRKLKERVLRLEKRLE